MEKHLLQVKKVIEFIIAVVNNNLAAFFAENKLLYLFIMLFLLSILFIELTIIYYSIILIHQAINL
jgi:hypothetical protein